MMSKNSDPCSFLKISYGLAEKFISQTESLRSKIKIQILPMVLTHFFGC